MGTGSLSRLHGGNGSTIIVEALAKQLGARVEIVRNPHGTTVSITHGTSDCVWQPLTGVGKHSPPKSNGGSFAAV
jgi:hypothetical protein